jgi:putative oxidoreductase
MAHGGQKLVAGIPETSRFMGEVGIPLPTLAAVFVTCVELLGGVAIVVGLVVRWAALLLAIDMVVALLAVQVKAGILRPGGAEFVLVLLGATVTLALHGGGQPSLYDP